MSFLKRIFGGGKPSRPMRDVAGLAKPLAVPALHVVATESASLSHFGGIPSLPKGAAWPQHEGTKLQFLARLSLSELHAVHAFDWLPKSGALLFFYDPEQRAWGFDPKDRGSWDPTETLREDSAGLKLHRSATREPARLSPRRLHDEPRVASRSSRDRTARCMIRAVGAQSHQSIMACARNSTQACGSRSISNWPATRKAPST